MKKGGRAREKEEGLEGIGKWKEGGAESVLYIYIYIQTPVNEKINILLKFSVLGKNCNQFNKFG